MDEILEVAAQDPELWVSMLSESMKTLPASGSLNTEISDYDHNDSRPIFNDMVIELKRLVNKTNDLRMLPLECQYLNKPALTALVGNQPAPTRHFVLKRKPKSTILRTELMQKSADAQSSLKKTSAPTVPLRSRGLPRKMTDTTPLKGIPSRVPSSGGFKTPTSTQTKASINRTTPAGRKDGGVKFLEIEDQPLGYAAAKKRKRQQELEEQQKRAENEQNAKVGDSSSATTPTTPTTTPDYAAGLTAPIAYSQPATPMPSTTDTAISTSIFTSATQSITNSTSTLIDTPVVISSKKDSKKDAGLLSPKRMKFEDDIEEIKASPSKNDFPVKDSKTPTKGEPKMIKVTRALPTLISAATSKPLVLTPTTSTIGSSYVTIKAVSAPNSTQSALSHLNIPSNTIVRTVQYVTTQAQQNAGVNVVTTKSPTAAMQKPTLIAKTNATGKPTILSNIVLTPNMRSSAPASSGTTSYVISSPNNKIVQRVVVSSGQNINLPTLTTRTAQPTIIQPMQQGTPTKIVQIKTTPTILGMTQNQSTMQNIPPLISTQQPTLLNIQNSRKTVTLTAQQQPQTQQSQSQAQQQKVNQILMPSGVQMKGKTIIVSNQNQNMNLGQRNVILQSVGPGGNPIYQQIPITSGVLRTIADQNQQKTSNQIPALVPTSNLTQNIPHGLVIANTSNQQVQQTVPRLITNIATIQPQQAGSNHVQIRPVLTAVPQGGQLHLIQRPGQQAQLVQATQIMQPQTIQKTIITRPQVVVQAQQNAQQTSSQASGASTTIKVATTAAAGGQRRGLSLSVSVSKLIFDLKVARHHFCSTPIVELQTLKLLCFFTVEARRCGE